MKANNKTTFSEWTKEIDACLEARIGLSASDLPDSVYTLDCFEDGLSPEEVADMLLEEFGEY